MINTLLTLVAVTSFALPSTSLDSIYKEGHLPQPVLRSEIPPIFPQVDSGALITMIRAQAPSLNDAVINKVVTALKCSSIYDVHRTNILSVIDYSLPSNQKRLWIFDLANNTLLFNTYVSHGIKSGTLLTDFFSNKYNSRASSIGVYKTEQAYYGREGLSLRLTGLDRAFNDNAMNRAIVMHGGWYMDEEFIKHYGRPGRSWGCPAVPLTQYQPIINAIKENSLLVVYYPNDEWFGKSKFLTCDKVAAQPMQKNNKTATAVTPVTEHRDDVFFAQVLKGGEDKPILTMPVSRYEQVFHTKPPLERMLRRQINKEEYIALSNKEVAQISVQDNPQVMSSLYFVIPTLKMVRGYYETEMKIVTLGGTIQHISAIQQGEGSSKSYQVSFNSNSAVRIQATDRFIRWLGL